MKEIRWEWERKARNWNRKTTIRWKEKNYSGFEGGKMSWMETGQPMRSDCASFSTLLIFNFCCWFFLSTFHNWRCCNKLLFTVKKAFGMKQNKKHALIRSHRHTKVRRSKNVDRKTTTKKTTHTYYNRKTNNFTF